MTSTLEQLAEALVAVEDAQHLLRIQYEESSAEDVRIRLGKVEQLLSGLIRAAQSAEMKKLLEEFDAAMEEMKDA